MKRTEKLASMDYAQDRVDDALALWQAGRREGAFLLAIVAVVVRAREDFPRPMGEAESFRRRQPELHKLAAIAATSPRHCVADPGASILGEVAIAIFRISFEY